MARNHKQVFTDIYRTRSFGSSKSASGPGSDIEATVPTRNTIQHLLALFDVKTMLDIPCGDFHWMQLVNLGGVQYIGADIVDQLIEKNKELETDSIQFKHLDLLTDALPPVDLVVCRDCLVHFPNRDVEAALLNLCDSGSTYLLTTTFPKHTNNKDISAGRWRPLNLEMPPFNLPQPLELRSEEWTKDGCAYSDKSLGLWSLRDIEYSLQTNKRIW